MNDGAGFPVRDWERAFNGGVDSDKISHLEAIIEEKDEIILKISKELEDLKSLIRNIRQ
jgi:hypothetical protein